jgi:hypothetical protein
VAESSTTSTRIFFERGIAVQVSRRYPPELKLRRNRLAAPPDSAVRVCRSSPEERPADL